MVCERFIDYTTNCGEHCLKLCAWHSHDKPSVFTDGTRDDKKHKERDSKC